VLVEGRFDKLSDRRRYFLRASSQLTSFQLPGISAAAMAAFTMPPMMNG